MHCLLRSSRLAIETLILVLGVTSLILSLFLVSLAPTWHLHNIHGTVSSKIVLYANITEDSYKNEKILQTPPLTIRNLTHQFITDTVRVLSWRPRISIWPQFLSAEECDYIVKLAGHKVKRSEVVRGSRDVISDLRTSYGYFIAEEANDPLLLRIDSAIATWTHLPPENGEYFYLLRYEKGQEYKPHYDWFEPNSEHVARKGNRVATVLIYLSDVEEGGETVFPLAENGPIAIKPRKGDAVLFWNMLPNGCSVDKRALHGAEPVIKGVKYCLTRWIHEIPIRPTRKLTKK